MRALCRAISLVLIVGACWAAPVAQASSPPRGDYSCTSGPTSSYDGELYILDGSHYRINLHGPKGSYSTRGRSITFGSGPYHRKVKGKWYKTTEGRYEIALTSLKTGFTSEYCNRA